MKHGIKKYKFGVGSDYNKALMRNLAKSVILHEQIKTTLAKAKALRPFVEKLVTKAKTESLARRREVISTLGSDCTEAKKLFEVLGKRYQERPGGYLRIMKAGYRRGDKAAMAVIEFVDRDTSAKGKYEVKKVPDNSNAG